MTEKQDNDAALFLFLVGVLIALAIIILPFVWSSAKAELSKTKVSVIVSDECKAGSSCQICTETAQNRSCITGVCDAQQNCIVPSPKNATPKIPEKGPRSLVIN
jgi:hypothetical protein